jgi:uncharacterized protein
MKFLIVILVVFAVLWFLRNNRQGDPPARGARREPPQLEPQDMVRCPVCSLHLPRTDALPGPDGRLYCCAEHRLRAEG